MMLAIIACLDPWVIDGDSLRCRGPGGFVGEVRLLGVDAPDYTFSRPCRGKYGDHVCDDRAAKVAKGTLIRAKQTLGPMRIEPVTKDRYGRTVAQVWAGSTNLSCWQPRSTSGVRYIVKYDHARHIARACGLAK
jgi:micrococcal nuclease